MLPLTRKAPSTRVPQNPARPRALPIVRVLLVAMLAGCATLPPVPADRAATTFSAAADSRLGGLTAALASEHAPLNGVRVLDSGRDALHERAALIESAQHSIDAQYYIWNGDNSGIYLASRIWAAAERGVRVRLLLDDINVGGRDSNLARLAAHPNIDIRIYNPFASRNGAGQVFGFLGEFARLNRRMHNKSFTVDGVVTIVGGRNIGDEYFDAGVELNFRDRDVVVIGPAVASVGAMFDTFWNADLSRDVTDFLAADMTTGDFASLSAAPVATATAALGAIHTELPDNSDAAMAELRQSFARMVWAPARLIYDPPPAADAVGQTAVSQPSAAALGELALATRGTIEFESAYLVLDDDTLAGIAGIRATGVRIRGLTNSLASNDVTANHAAYAKKRDRIIASGIELYELRPDAPSCRALVSNAVACGPEHVFGLHSKTIVFDRRSVYVGSLNLNLRSRYLNSESGMIIDSPVLAEEIAAAIEQNMQPANSWRVVLDADGDPVWITEDAAGNTIETRSDPQTSWTRRWKSGFIGLFPLEKYL